jgi:hypothetical protein
MAGINERGGDRATNEPGTTGDQNFHTYPVQVQLNVPERDAPDESTSAAFAKVNVPEPSALKVAETVACFASGL